MLVWAPGTASEARRRIERHLSALVADPRATPDAVAWACGQLELVGAAESVGALSRLLDDPRNCDAACTALRAIPCPEADAALVEALDTGDDVCVAAVAAALGQRRTARAAAPLARLALSPDAQTAAAALDSLGAIGTPEAGRLLAGLDLAPELRDRRAVALLRCAQRLVDSHETQAASALLRGVLEGDPPTGGALPR
jgi:HEAT repeat protein